jgi:thioredoxin 1
MYLRGGIMMKPATNKTLYMIIVSLFLVCLAMVPAPSEGKEPTTPEAKSLPTLIEFGKGTCTPCKMMKPILEGLKKEYAGVLNVEIIDLRYNPGATKKYNIRAFPFQIFYDAAGKEVKRNYGIPTKEQILDMFKSVGIDLRQAKAEGRK